MKNKNSSLLKKTSKKFTKTQKVMVFILLLLLFFISFPIVLILFIGLLPTITVMLTDKKNYDKQMIVGCFNIAGVFFYLFSILGNFATPTSDFLISDIFNLILMLISAGIGLILYNEVPRLYIAYMKNMSQKQMEKINSKLDKINSEWGIDSLQNKN